jgi:hypothetical protein
MDKDHAKTIPISNILDKLNIKPKKINQSKGLYLSPIRKVTEPSFWVYFGNNRWYDYKLSKGGDPIDFAIQFLSQSNESHTIVDALRWLQNMADDKFSVPNIPADAVDTYSEEPVLVLRSLHSISFKGLIVYLEKLGIPLSLAQTCMKETRVFNKNTGKTFFALGVKNENGGYELINPFFTGCIKPRTITFIRGTKPQPRGIHVFKNVIDYTSLLAELEYSSFEHDTILLNSLSCAQLAVPYIQNYPYQTMHTWLDNDLAGHQATNILSKFAVTQPSLTHLKMNKVYAQFKDISEWSIHKNGLAE